MFIESREPGTSDLPDFCISHLRLQLREFAGAIAESRGLNAHPFHEREPEIANASVGRANDTAYTHYYSRHLT